MEDTEKLRAEVERLTKLIENSKKALRYILDTIKLETAERIVLARTLNAFGDEL